MQARKLFGTGILPDCEKCLQRLIKLTAEQATSDEAIREKAVKSANQILEKLKNMPGINPAHIANRFHPVIKTICENPDPFRKMKEREILTAEELAAKYPPGKEWTFKDYVKYSLIGNSIDFFRNPEKLEEYLNEGLTVARDEREQLIQKLRGASKKVLVLCDNAGEVFFDLPLLRVLASQGHEVFYGVKGAPIQNDLSWDDVSRLCIEWNGIQVVSTGAAMVGLELDRCSGYFRELYGKADIIIGKGMGHFETLGNSGDERVFLLFQAKCRPVAETIGVPLNSGVACFVKGGGF